MNNGILITVCIIPELSYELKLGVWNDNWSNYVSMSLRASAGNLKHIKLIVP